MQLPCVLAVAVLSLSPFFLSVQEGQGDEVSSYPYPEYAGGPNGTSLRWEADDLFGYVPKCNRELRDLIILDGVDYGSDGQFTISFWFKANNSAQKGDLFEYIFSHSANATRQHYSTVDTFQPNQVHMFLPEQGHPAHGLLRSVVKDSIARPLSTFLDSDGRINDNGERSTNAPASQKPLNDGTWHQAVLTPLPDSPGFQVYIDGTFAAQLPPFGYKAGLNDSFVVDGGHTMKMGSGDIYLCGRSDGSRDRHYSGSISHLQIYDDILTPSQVMELYESVPVKRQSSSIAPGPKGLDLPFIAKESTESLAPALAAFQKAIVQAASPLANFDLPDTLQDMVRPDLELAPMPGEVQQMTIRGIPCVFPFHWQGKEHNECVAVPSSPATANPSNATYCIDASSTFSMCSQEHTDEFNSMIDYLEQYVDMPFSRLQSDNGKAVLCSVNASSSMGLPPCAQGLRCARLRDDQVSQLGPSRSALWNGTFGPAQIGVCAKPEGVYWPPYWAIRDMAVPAAYFPLTNYSTTSWPVPEYWFWNTTRENKTEWVKDPVFGTVVECSDAWDSSLSVSHLPWGERGAFAINLWMKQNHNRGDKFQYLFSTRSKGHPAIDEKTIFYPDQVHIYLPDRGHPAHGTVRTIVKDNNDDYMGAESRVWLDSDSFLGSNDIRNTPRNNFTDGAWHMGYALYVDGALHGNLTSPEAFFHVDGGDPINLDSEIVLCGRSDKQTSRFFDGRVAQLALFDAALHDYEVGALYTAVTGKAPRKWNAEAPAEGPYAGLLEQLMPIRDSDSSFRNPFFMPSLDGRRGGVFQGSLDKDELAPFQHKRQGMHPAAIAGIAAGATAFVAVIAGMIVAMVLKKKRSSWQKTEFPEDGVPGVGGAPTMPGTDKRQLFVGEHSSPIDVHVTAQ